MRVVNHPAAPMFMLHNGKWLVLEWEELIYDEGTEDEEVIMDAFSRWWIR